MSAQQVEGRIPAERLRPILADEERRAGGRGALAAEMEASGRFTEAGAHKFLYRLENEPDGTVSFDTADALMQALDLAHLADKVFGDDDAPRVQLREWWARLDSRKIAAAYTLYESGLSLRQVGALLCERYGYTSADTAGRELLRLFRTRGYQRRSHREAGALRFRDARCSECGCHVDKRTKGCRLCRSRHGHRRHNGGRYVEIRCTGCGCALAERTVGCGNCTGRHHWRKRNGLSVVAAPRRETCAACGGPHDERTRGCGSCYSRHRWRRAQAKRALASEQAGAAFGSSDGGGTTTTEEAA